VAVTHLIFGNLLGEGVMWMIPIILIVVCLGLGMDYDILLTTRIKENAVHRGMSNDDAIRYAVTRSGSVITICGLIMGGAFGTLMLSGTVMLQEFGFALSFAIIIDALLVRTYIVPAAMHLLGDWNWKGPKFLHKIGARPPE
jgi:RND superfamily putative drug exporter